MDSENKDTPVEKEQKAPEVSKPKLVLDEVTGEMVSKSELKKRTKKRKNEKAKEEKAAKKKLQEEEKKAKAAAAGPGVEAPTIGGDETLDPSKYTQNRRDWLNSRRAEGENPYPHKFQRTHRIDEFIAAFKENAEEGIFQEDKPVAITGRVITIRGSGKHLVFYDIGGDTK